MEVKLGYVRDVKVGPAISVWEQHSTCGNKQVITDFYYGAVGIKDRV